MKITIRASRAEGVVRAIPSKSHAHRLLIAAALADAPCRLNCPAVSRDIRATVRCLNALGADIKRTEDGYDIIPADRDRLPLSPVLNCGESGSTLRFLLPVAAFLGTGATFTGEGRLPSRPVSELAECLRSGGASFSADALPLTLGGKAHGEKFEVDASVSSQYVSGMLFALAADGGAHTLVTKGKAVSAGYTEMTTDALALFGKRVVDRDGVYEVPPGRLRSPGSVRAEGDWSNAAFMLAAGALTGDVTVTGTDPNSRQRDRAIVDILSRMGARVYADHRGVRAVKAPLRAVDVDVTDIPDLAPVLSVLMACAEGESRMTGVRRLIDKESDRLAGIRENLAAMGIVTREEGDALTICGGKLRPFSAKGNNDHRMVMSAAVAALVAGGSVDDAEAVEKSYPGFFEDLKAIGGATDETI